MRILMLGHEWFEDHPGGAGRYMGEVARRLAARGHAVTVCVPKLAPDTPEWAEVGGVQIRRLALSPGVPAWIAGFWRAVGELVARQGPFDVVHSHFALTGLAPLWHPALASARRVCQFQGPWAGESALEGGGKLTVGLKYALERLAYARCDRFITLSQAFADLLAWEYAVPSAKVTVIPAGIDTERFSPVGDSPSPSDSRTALRARLGLPDGPVVFVMRRLVRRMGLDVLLVAWQSVVQALPGARLYIAGDGQLRPELAKMAGDLGIAASLVFLGRISDDEALAHYQAADLTVLPSLSLEGFGLVTVESLACGTPVLGTTTGATPEILAPLSPDLLVPPGDGRALAERLVALLSHPKRLPSHQACRNYVLEHYAWPTIITRLEGALTGE